MKRYDVVQMDREMFRLTSTDSHQRALEVAHAEGRIIPCMIVDHQGSREQAVQEVERLLSNGADPAVVWEYLEMAGLIRRS